MNTKLESKDVVTPSCCNKCDAIQGRPPAWLRVLEAMSPGSGARVSGYTLTAIAGAAKMSRQHVLQVLPVAIKAGLIEHVTEFKGVRMYRKTAYGTQILSRWKTAGWRA